MRVRIVRLDLDRGVKRGDRLGNSAGFEAKRAEQHGRSTITGRQRRDACGVPFGGGEIFPHPRRRREHDLKSGVAGAAGGGGGV